LPHEKAAQVAESSQNVAQVAEAGRVTVEETMAAFEKIQNQMSVVAESINRLNDQTQAVHDIMATVNDLAEQSNLLSVNASIEAAKAGDQGKGFTVVAQEVKNLAEQSKHAVSKVRVRSNKRSRGCKSWLWA
jgi:methyl-accepting chemotaxis protein